MEYTRENIIKSLRACSSPSESACTRCLYGDFEEGCRDQLRLAAAAMLEEIGKGELPRRSVAEKREPTMDELWIEHEMLRGRATVFSRVTCVEMLPTHGDAPDNIQDLKEINAYYTGICDAAIAVIEANQANNGLPY